MVIAQCASCLRERRAHWQDVEHGFGRRVFGVALEKGSGHVRRCTVCANETDFAAASHDPSRGEGKLKKKGKVPSGKNPVKKERR